MQRGRRGDGPRPKSFLRTLSGERARLSLWLKASGARATLVEAAASTMEGNISFLSGLGGGSREVADALGTMTLPAVDLFPSLLGADFVKVDIEGGEWPTRDWATCAISRS